MENPTDYNNGERGFNEGGGQQSYDNGNGVPGEGRPPNFSNNNIGNSYPVGGGYGDNSYAANQNSYDSVKPGGQDGFGGPDAYNKQQEDSNVDAFGGQKKQLINYQNDGNLGTAYAAAVGNALPTNSKPSDKFEL